MEPEILDALCGAYAYLCCLTKEQLEAIIKTYQRVGDNGLKRIYKIACQCAVPPVESGALRTAQKKVQSRLAFNAASDCLLSGFSDIDLCSGESKAKLALASASISVILQTGIGEPFASLLRAMQAVINAIISSCLDGSMSAQTASEICNTFASWIAQYNAFPSSVKAALDIIGLDPSKLSEPFKSIFDTVSSCCGTNPSPLPGEPAEPSPGLLRLGDIYLSYEDIVIEVQCGAYDLSCICDDRDKVVTLFSNWLERFGEDRTRRLINFICCRVNPPMPPVPPGPPPPPVEPPPPPPPPADPPSEPEPIACVLPDQGNSDNARSARPSPWRTRMSRLAPLPCQNYLVLPDAAARRQTALREAMDAGIDYDKAVSYVALSARESHYVWSQPREAALSGDLPVCVFRVPVGLELLQDGSSFYYRDSVANDEDARIWLESKGMLSADGRAIGPALISNSAHIAAFFEWVVRVRPLGAPHRQQSAALMLDNFSVGPTQQYMYFSGPCARARGSDTRPYWPDTYQDIWALYTTCGAANILENLDYLDHVASAFPTTGGKPRAVDWLTNHTGNATSAEAYYEGTSGGPGTPAFRDSLSLAMQNADAMNYPHN